MILNNTITYSHIHHHKISMHGRFRYIHPQDIDHFYSLKTNRWLHLMTCSFKKVFFCLQTSRGLPCQTTNHQCWVPSFHNHKSQRQTPNQNTVKIDKKDMMATMLMLVLMKLFLMMLIMMLMMMLTMMSRKNVSSLISGTQTSWHWSAASRSPKQNTSLIPAHIYTQQWKSFKKEDLPLDIT